MVIHVKNMVCDRCKLAVAAKYLKKQGFPPVHVDQGTVTVESPAQDHYNAIDERLLAQGFERIDDRHARIIENIKSAVIRKIHYGEYLQ